MCFAFSGRCLISALQKGRVPNRGSCANDCRFDYEYYVKNPDNGVMMRLVEEEGVGTHIFNAKDLNLSGHIAEILSSNAISALKIEGRTKSSYYAAQTTRIYRLAVDDFYHNTLKPSFYASELNTLKNRGFTDGYLMRRPFERLDTQNHQTAISEGDFQVNGEITEDGRFFACKFTTTTNTAYEIIAPKNAAITPIVNEIGKIYTFEKRSYLVLYKILLENNTELETIHSGNVNLVRLPAPLPAFSFLRTQVEPKMAFRD